VNPREMTTREIANFRRREISTLRCLMGRCRTSPGARQLFEKKLRACQKQLKMLVG